MGRTLSLLLAVAFAALLVGCGDGAPPGKVEDGKAIDARRQEAANRDGGNIGQSGLGGPGGTR